MSVGMICTLFAIIAIIVVSVWTYKKRDVTSNHPLVISVSLIAFVLSTSTALYLFFGEHTGDKCNCNVDYSDTSITILSILVTVILGWNIWSVIDTKDIQKKVSNIDEKYEERFRKLVNNNDDTLGGIELDFARMIIIKSSDNKEYDALLLVVHILNSMYYYSRSTFDNSLLQLNECSKLFNENENNIKRLSLNQESYNMLRRMISKINRQDEIDDFDKIQNIIIGLNPNRTK